MAHANTTGRSSSPRPDKGGSCNSFLLFPNFQMPASHAAPQPCGMRTTSIRASCMAHHGGDCGWRSLEHLDHIFVCRDERGEERAADEDSLVSKAQLAIVERLADVGAKLDELETHQRKLALLLCHSSLLVGIQDRQPCGLGHVMLLARAHRRDIDLDQRKHQLAVLSKQHELETQGALGQEADALQRADVFGPIRADICPQANEEEHAHHPILLFLGFRKVFKVLDPAEELKEAAGDARRLGEVLHGLGDVLGEHI
mmetsp:Transcript_2702/g.7440  ORF Transcript_2702/g.7440 Transcript_2702/m.7440 type:complete len:257 (+) Transcript_2702:237-1007(+)